MNHSGYYVSKNIYVNNLNFVTDISIPIGSFSMLNNNFKKVITITITGITIFIIICEHLA